MDEKRKSPTGGCREGACENIQNPALKNTIGTMAGQEKLIKFPEWPRLWNAMRQAIFRFDRDGGLENYLAAKDASTRWRQAHNREVVGHE